MYIKDYEQHCGSLGKSFKGYTVAKVGKQLVYEKRNKSLKQNKAAHVIAGPLLAQHLIDGSVTIMRQRKKRKQAVHHDPCSPESQGAKFVLFQAPFKVGKYFPKITVRQFTEMLTKDWNKTGTEGYCAVKQIFSKKLWQKVVNIPGVMTSKTDGGQPLTYGEWLEHVVQKKNTLVTFSNLNPAQKKEEADKDRKRVPYEYEGNDFWTQEEERKVAEFLDALHQAAECTFLSQLWKMARNGAKSSKVRALAKDIKSSLIGPKLLAFGAVAQDKAIDAFQITNSLFHIKKQINDKGKRDACVIGRRTGNGLTEADMKNEKRDIPGYDNDEKGESAGIKAAKKLVTDARAALSRMTEAEEIEGGQQVLNKVLDALAEKRKEQFVVNFLREKKGSAKEAEEELKSAIGGGGGSGGAFEDDIADYDQSVYNPDGN